jgi:hypothetical protein
MLIVLIFISSFSYYSTNFSIDNNTLDELYFLDIDHHESEFLSKASNNTLIEYVKKTYEKKIYNIDHLFFSAKNPSKMYILFTSAVKNVYSMWSWF